MLLISISLQSGSKDQCSRGHTYLFVRWWTTRLAKCAIIKKRITSNNQSVTHRTVCIGRQSSRSVCPRALARQASKEQAGKKRQASRQPIKKTVKSRQQNFSKQCELHSRTASRLPCRAYVCKCVCVCVPRLLDMLTGQRPAGECDVLRCNLARPVICSPSVDRSRWQHR